MNDNRTYVNYFPEFYVDVLTVISYLQFNFYAYF